MGDTDNMGSRLQVRNRIRKPRFRLAQRIAIVMTLAMLIFVLIIGAAFTMIFRTSAKDELEESLTNTAVIISNLMSKTLASSQDYYPSFQRPEGSDDFGRFPGQSDFWISDKALISFINNLTESDVWIVDSRLAILSYSGSKSIHPLSVDKLSKNEITGIEQIMSDDGYIIYSEAFSGTMGYSCMSVGVPVYSSAGRNIVGAVLVHSSTKPIDTATINGLLILVASSLVALGFGLVMSVVIAKAMTKPMIKISDAAVMISEGDYSIKTGVRRCDEIGQLARTIDEMSEKLAAADKESQKLEKLRQDFISNISHELRTPVTVMRSSLEALCEGVVTDSEQVAQYHQHMLSESVYLQRMVNDLLDLSRLQNADFQMNVGVFNLYDCLNDAVRSAKRIAVSKNRSIDFEYDSSIFTVTGDYDRVRQLFLIVLDNAIKFSSENDDGFAVPVKVVFQEGNVSITNYGSEIAPADLPFIFDRFFKSHSEENKQGTGLGLAIAKQIASRHGIGVKVMSRSLVTSFVFEFKKETEG